VTDERGRPVAAGFVMGKFGPRSYYALDTTRDDVLAATEARFRRLRDLGFRLFKLDFLTAASVAGVRADPKATRLQAYRRGMEAIRRGAGEDAVLLAGISPILANVGLFDVHRLGPDTCFGAPSWRTTFQRWLRDRMTPGAANNIAGSIQRAFTNDVLWSGDCDATLGSGLAPSELRLLVTVNLLLGSSVTVGHDLRTGPFDWAPLREIRTTGPARVLDRAAPAPAHLLARGELRGAPATFYAMVNTGDAARDLAPHPAAVPSPAEAPDYWTGERVALDPGRALVLPARSVRLFVLST
jgi:alpha-galactosidase